MGFGASHIGALGHSSARALVPVAWVSASTLSSRAPTGEVEHGIEPRRAVVV